jgi:hypothetical protein
MEGIAGQKLNPLALTSANRFQRQARDHAEIYLVMSAAERDRLPAGSSVEELFVGPFACRTCAAPSLYGVYRWKSTTQGRDLESED